MHRISLRILTASHAHDAFEVVDRLRDVLNAHGVTFESIQVQRVEGKEAEDECDRKKGDQ